MTPSIEHFGETPDGQSVERITISGGGLTASILSYGATVQDLRFAGTDHPLVLGSPTIEPYFGPMMYFGALVGRFANRIGHGRFPLEDRDHQSDRNWLDKHSLHGGAVGTGQRIWSLVDLKDDRLVFTLELADGEMGFPGEMRVAAAISLPGAGALEIDIEAVADTPTPCSFAHHGFFNLNGSDGITGHTLQIDADSYLPVDQDLIPTGMIAPVEGSRFDFRTPRPVGSTGYDHNFCLSDGRRPIRPVATLRDPETGQTMRVETTEPGLQVYDGAYFPAEGLAGLDGKIYEPFWGIALETQAWPDAPNRPNFPPAILRPDEVYNHRVRYVFEPAADL